MEAVVVEAVAVAEAVVLVALPGLSLALAALIPSVGKKKHSLTMSPN